MSADLLRRVEATNRTMAKYRERQFDWQGATCIHLARYHLRGMGYTPQSIPRFYSPIGAKRAMRDAGFDSLADVFDSLGLMRIAPAQMLVGDIAVLPGDDLFDAVVICAGAKLLGWHDASIKGGIEPIAEAIGSVTGAWRL